MMPVDDIVPVAEIGIVGSLKKQHPTLGLMSIKIVLKVIIIIDVVYNRIVDLRVRAIQPCDDILIHRGSQLIEICLHRADF